MQKVLLAYVLHIAAGGVCLSPVQFVLQYELEEGSLWKQVFDIEAATVCIIWQFKALLCTLVKKAKRVFI